MASLGPVASSRTCLAACSVGYENGVARLTRLHAVGGDVLALGLIALAHNRRHGAASHAVSTPPLPTPHQAILTSRRLRRLVRHSGVRSLELQLLTPKPSNWPRIPANLPRRAQKRPPPQSSRTTKTRRRGRGNNRAHNPPKERTFLRPLATYSLWNTATFRSSARWSLGGRCGVHSRCG